MRVTVIGTGYVGTVTGVCLAYLGHKVTCVDTDEAKVRRLQNHDIPIYEPGLAELLVLAEQEGGIDFTAHLAPAVRESDVIFIAVGTPPLPTGEANLTYLEAAARSVGAAMDSSRFRVIVNKSTVPVGCGNLVETLVREGIREQSPWKEREIGFGIASNPEFLREGSAIADSLFPDRIVLGGQDERTLNHLHDLYAPLVSQQFPAPPFCPRPAKFRMPVPVVTTTLTSAEMIKYAANAFLAMKIGFANEIANICEKVDADAPEVMTGIGLDSRIGTAFLNAGIGWGGSCFGKDVQSLMHIAGDYGYQARLLEASLAVNRLQRQLVIQKLQEKLYILKGRTIALLGLAFKPNTDDLRDAPSLQIIERLLQMGARIRAYDPIAMDVCREHNSHLKICYCDSALHAAENADALVLVTEWPEFAKLDLEEVSNCMAQPILVDGRNLFDPQIARAAGFDYTGIGRTEPRVNTRRTPVPVALAR
ncbi:UDP-glucose dehydrogenase family protein [Nevskia soli]|jgi:UDPglucose 6-dehydrogenase|uniref:UDP-glucose dehydrogenase family protein n=1 Tax=Nevskia soli TaxID=418856 RepID=UPI0015D8E74D|nr:UDP-glucose/GDP-mannose dehydrogenase family protein [Nevskia soli]